MVNQPSSSFVRRVVTASVLAVGLGWAPPASAQLDPLLFLKNLPPNVLLVVDTSFRMAQDADGTYYDPRPYRKRNRNWETSLGVTDGNTASNFRRKYNAFTFTVGGGYGASKIEIVGDLQSTYGTFDARSRIGVARSGMVAALGMNSRSVRFGLIKMRQTAVTIPANADDSKGNTSPVDVVDLGQRSSTDNSSNTWTINRAVVTAS